MILQSDTLLRVAISSFLEELKSQLWLIDDMFSDLTTDPLLYESFGKQEIANCKEWFVNNKISVLMKLRKDIMEFPCVTIALGSSSEEDAQATLADQSTVSEFLKPEYIGQPIPYIVKPFPVDYLNGILVPPSTVDLSNVQPGMLIVDPKTGNAYPIEAFNSSTSLLIENSPNLTATEYGIIPHYRYWKARRERAMFRESYSIGCHVVGEPAAVLWLHTIVLYGILRYRETLLEHRGFENSSVSSSDLARNESFPIGGDDVTSRYITLTGLAENTWLKSPKRTIEKVKVTNVFESNLASDPAIVGTNNPITTVPEGRPTNKTKNPSRVYIGKNGKTRK